jgi:uncharacterized protein with PQ loop repeat
MTNSLAYLIGTIGNLLFGFKSLFQVIKCYKSKSTDGLSFGMLGFDFLGNTCCAYFIFATTGFTLWPQFVNYFFATLFLIILFIMIFIYKK